MILLVSGEPPGINGLNITILNVNNLMMWNMSISILMLNTLLDRIKIIMKAYSKFLGQE